MEPFHITECIRIVLVPQKNYCISFTFSYIVSSVSRTYNISVRGVFVLRSKNSLCRSVN